MANAPRSSEITMLLAQLAEGDAEARERLAVETYRELKRVARQQLGSSRGTLQPTILTHEAFVRLFRGATVQPADRRQFFGLAAKVMRDLIVDHARAKSAAKRGGGAQRVTLAAIDSAPGSDIDILDLNEALEELGQRDPSQRNLVELRFFAGLQMAEVAEILDVSLSTVEREWRAARAWLAVRLSA